MKTMYKDLVQKKFMDFYLSSFDGFKISFYSFFFYLIYFRNYFLLNFLLWKIIPGPVRNGHMSHLYQFRFSRIVISRIFILLRLEPLNFKFYIESRNLQNRMRGKQNQRKIRRAVLSLLIHSQLGHWLRSPAEERQDRIHARRTIDWLSSNGILAVGRPIIGASSASGCGSRTFRVFLSQAHRFRCTNDRFAIRGVSRESAHCKQRDFSIL